MRWESLRSVVANVLDRDIVISEFKLQSRHDVHFQTDPIYPIPPLGQDMTQGQFLSGI